MKALFLAVSALFLLAMSGAGVLADGVYVTRGENGPVFTDKPQPGAKEVPLKPLNVVQPTTDKQKAEKRVPEPNGVRSAKDQPAVAYRSLSIVSPEDNGSVAGNTTTFEVRLASDPPLLLGEGHAFVVRINGRFVEQRYTATEFMIPPEFWADGYVPANESMQIEASIVDGAGQVVMRAAPAVFHTREVFVQRRYYPAPVYPVYPGHPHYVPPRTHPPRTKENVTPPASTVPRPAARSPALKKSTEDTQADSKK